MLKRLILLVVVLSAFTSCGDDEFGTNPATIGGLFITWRLSSTTTTCPNEAPVIVEPEDAIDLTIRSKTYRVLINDVLVREGDLSFDGKDMFFAPSPFPNNPLGTATFVFNGADLILSSAENKNAGTIETCSVRRSYRIASRD